MFEKQFSDGIIEEIKVSPSDYDQHIWVPSRQVINCSLKTNKELLSLNEAADPGVDLVGIYLEIAFFL